jgi:hypothetical protein
MQQRDMNGRRIILVLFGSLTVIVALLSGSIYAGGFGRMSVPSDWSHRHLIFSPPTSVWQSWKLQQEPRYWHQWLGRDEGGFRRGRSTGQDTDMVWHRPRSGGLGELHTDWGMSLLSGGAAGVGVFPAKFSFDVNATPSCTSDFVVFNTSQTGTAARATIIAFNQLYATQGSVGGFCNSNGPAVMWSYNTGTGSIVTSVVLSLDGSKVAFVETAAGGATLRILKWKSGEGTAINLPATPTTTITAGQDWTTCPAANSCMASIAFNNGIADTSSAPFCDYNSDTIYVGDINSALHKFTGVFSGKPAEITTGWPITINGTHNLSSPVFDSVSKNIFVGDDQGRLSYVREVGSVTGACASGSAPCLGTPNIALGGAVVDGPIVDPSAGRVYFFDGSDTTNHGSVVQTDTALGNARTVSIGGMNAGSDILSGAFDNAYLTGSFSTGHLIVCGKDSTANNTPALHRIGFAASGLMNTTSDGSLTLATANGVECSPVTEIFDGTTDRVFLSVQNDANQTTAGCLSGAQGCIMSLNLGGTWPPAAVTHGVSARGGTSGIIVDNIGAGAQESNIYFTFRTNSTAAVPCNGASGIGCAVKLTQSALQ